MYDIVADGGVVVDDHVAEEADHIVIRLAADVDIAEEDDHVVIDGPLGVDRTEEADRVVDVGADGDVDVREELDSVARGMGGQGSQG